jgi:hypothetical protein
MLLIPYLQDIINQPVNDIVFLKSNVINVIKAEKSELVDTYIKSITGIETGGELILG